MPEIIFRSLLAMLTAFYAFFLAKDLLKINFRKQKRLFTGYLIIVFTFASDALMLIK